MTFQNQIIIYQNDDWRVNIQTIFKDENFWLTQEQIAMLYWKSKSTINEHIKNIYKEWELLESKTLNKFGISEFQQKALFYYNLDMILAVWYRVKSKNWILFRNWATHKLKEYIIKGFVMDDERLKNPDWRPDYFDELLERIRDIRASEKRFYQKVKDLFKLSSDYDNTDKSTQLFFAETQNKILFAITWKTASEIIMDRAKPGDKNMWLTSWKWNVVRKQDIYIAKNYLTEDEIDNLNRFVMVFLETAELRAKNKQDITIEFWRENVDKIIELNDKIVLDNNWTVSNIEMREFVDKIYEQFDDKRKVEEARQEDLIELKEIEDLEKKLKQKE